MYRAPGFNRTNPEEPDNEDQRGYMWLVETSEPCTMPKKSMNNYYSGNYIGSHLKKKLFSLESSAYSSQNSDAVESVCSCYDFEKHKNSYYAENSPRVEFTYDIQNAINVFRNHIQEQTEQRAFLQAREQNYARRMDTEKDQQPRDSVQDNLVEDSAKDRDEKYRYVAGASSSRDPRLFKICIESILNNQDKRRTCMIKNVPNSLTYFQLCSIIDKNFKDEYEDINLMMDPVSGYNLGYAFISFKDVNSVIKLFTMYNGRKWEKRSSLKVIEITYARIQCFK